MLIKLNIDRIDIGYIMAFALAIFALVFTVFMACILLWRDTFGWNIPTVMVVLASIILWINSVAVYLAARTQKRGHQTGLYEAKQYSTY